MLIGGVAPDGNFTSSVETLDAAADRPQWCAGIVDRLAGR